MGSSTSCPSASNHVDCSCFHKEQSRLASQSRPIVRYTAMQWVWLHSHEEALMHCVCSLHSDAVEKLLIPKDILRLIKDHCYHPCAPLQHFNTLPVVRHEIACNGVKQLLSPKKLCPYWYTKHVADNSEFDVISIGMHLSGTGSTAAGVEHFISSLPDNHQLLPALSTKPNRCHHTVQDLEVRRTVFVDGCQITLQFIAMDERRRRLLSYAMMHVIVLGEHDSVNSVNVHCQRIWNASKSMENVLVFGGGKHAKVAQEIAAVCNVPLVQSDLLQFLVKYYWFRQTCS